jgi:AbrB family transcriptional regulator, transcriptional pleiotropic regulator of transition state genes
MTRRIDALGRIVIPAELRRVLEIGVGDLLDIRVDNGHIVLAKVEQTCVFCRSNDASQAYRGKLVCPVCVAGLTHGETGTEGYGVPDRGAMVDEGIATASS